MRAPVSGGGQAGREGGRDGWRDGWMGGGRDGWRDGRRRRLPLPSGAAGNVRVIQGLHERETGV